MIPIDIAVGNVLGACGMNVAMIVVLDFLQRGESINTRVSNGHILAAAFSFILIVTVTRASLLLLLVYLLNTYVLYMHGE